jgi:hypothetical protein
MPSKDQRWESFFPRRIANGALEMDIWYTSVLVRYRALKPVIMLGEHD